MCPMYVLSPMLSQNKRTISRDLPQYVGMFDGIITPINKKPIRTQIVNLIDSKDSYKIPEDQISFEVVARYFIPL